MTLLPTLAVLLGLIGLALWIIPHQQAAPQLSITPRWDLPARMVIATAFVILLTGFATALGPQLSGLISPFPVFGMVLAVFAHSQQGPGAARQLLHGVTLGAFAFTSFFVVVGGLLPALGTVWTYLLASLAALAVNGATLHLAR